MGTAPILLQAQDVGGGYGRKQVVFDLSVDVRKGEIVAVLGHNGAGKTTTLKTLFGLLPLKDGRITYEGDDISNRLSTARNIKRGMALIPADNFVFGDLTVLDNLRLGGLHLDSNLNFDERFRYACELFPVLGERLSQQAGTLSGGERRMLSLSMALLRKPRLLMLDEPSLGLAPAVVSSIFNTIRELADTTGMAVLLLEQNVNQALALADRVYVMRNGRIIYQDSAERMRNQDASEWVSLF